MTIDEMTNSEAAFQAANIQEKDADAFNAALGEATKAKMAIEDDAKARYTALGKEFADFMLDRVSDDFKFHVAASLGLYSKIPDDLKEAKRAKKRDAALYAFFKSCFNKTTDIILHKDDQWPKENSASKVYALVKNLFMTVWLAQNDPDVKRILDSCGVEVNFRKDVDVISHGEENQADRDARDEIIEGGVKALRDIVEQNLAIEETIYPSLPEALKYDAEANPQGIKKSQFNNLVGVNLKKTQLADAGEMDKIKDLESKTSEKFFYDSVNQKLLFDAFQQVQ